jgi:hypothetical protein
MILLDSHQAAEEYPMIVSTPSLRLLLSNVRSIQCAHCVPPSSIHTEQYGIPHSAGFFVRNLRLVPHELSPSQKSGTNWNGNRITTSASVHQTLHLGVFSDQG